MQSWALVFPEIVTAIETIAQAEGSRYEATDNANIPFSITVHMNDQDQFTILVLGCNTPSILFHKKKPHSCLEHWHILMISSIGPG